MDGAVSVNGISSANNQTSATKRTPKNELGKDEFLKLLVTQLRYQDPMSPMENEDFIAQMAQFSALEQSQNMSGNLAQVHALGMLGKWVSGTTKEGELIEGLVTGVKVEKEGPKLMIGDKTINAMDVKEVQVVIINDGDNEGVSGDDENG